MVKQLKFIIIFGFIQATGAAVCLAAPAWVEKRPVLPDYYVGIGMAEKKSRPPNEAADFRQSAKNRALLDLAQEISVAVSGSYVEKIVEKTGLSEQTVRSELQTSSKARLQGHELVDQWEDRKVYWVYYRLSKAHYARLLNESRQTALRLAADMHKRAIEAEENHQIVSALRFDFEALQQISPFMGEALETAPDRGDQPLGNAIHAHLQHLLSAIQLAPSKPDFPVLAGDATPAEISVVVAYGPKGRGPSVVAQLPLAFGFPWRSENAVITKYTDPQGAARCGIAAATTADEGRSVDIAVNIETLFPSDDLIVKALLSRLSRPRSAVRLRVFQDREQYVWHHEFQNQKVAVLAAYQVDGVSQYWPKFGDEMMQLLKGVGADVRLPAASLPAEKIIALSDQSEGLAHVQAPADAEIMIVLAAVGQKNQRNDPKNQLGENAQFAGEFRTLVFKQGKTTFSDRYRAMSGWNPLGIQMCMDVSALHAFKRWKTRYRDHLYPH